MAATNAGPSSGAVRSARAGPRCSVAYGAHRCTSTGTSRPCTSRASGSPTAWSRPSNRTHHGPPRSPRSITTRVRPGTTPRPVRCRQRGAVPVLHALDPELDADGGVGEPGSPALDVRVAGAGDRVAVRVVRRPAEQGVDAFEQPVGDRVLKSVRLVVHLVRAEPHDTDEEGLQEAVPADDVPGVAGAVRRERRAVVRGALDEPVFGEPLEHHGHGRRRDAQMAGESGRAHLVAPARQHEDGAQRVLGRGGGHEPAARP